MLEIDGLQLRTYLLHWRRRQRQPGRRKTEQKQSLCRSVQSKFLFISLPSSAEQQREMTKFKVFTVFVEVEPVENNREVEQMK